jgi:16S rRNA (cytidine1402-2'-O)-methyltransferase
VSARLAVVATPIGNLGDLTPRAREALCDAAVVLAEDTRRTRPLLEQIGASGRLVSCHQHNEEQRVPLVLERLEAGDRVALVTDAGAPGVSDPGGRVVDAVAKAGLEVEVFPGASAVIAALMGAGLVSHRFLFLGFLPRRPGARRKVIEQTPDDVALVIFEAPARTDDTLAALYDVLGARRVVVGRELTKKFETFHRGVLGGDLEPAVPEKGEMVIVVEAGERERPPADENAVVAELLADETLPPKERARRLATAIGVTTREAYARLEEAKSAPPPADAASVPSATGIPSVHDAQARIGRAVAATAPARERLLHHLAEAARALLDADNAAAQQLGRRPGAVDEPPIGSDIPGADALMTWLERSPALPAPVEAQETARAVLTAMGAADLLVDGLAAIAGEDDEG